MYQVKKPYELPAKIEAPQCMYRIKPVNNINIVQGEALMNGSRESSQNSIDNKTAGNGGETPSGKKSKRKRAVSNSKSPEVSKDSRSQEKDNKKVVVKNDQKNNMTQVGNDNKADSDLREKIFSKLEARQNEVIKKLLHLRDMLNNVSATKTSTALPGSSPQGQPPQSVDVVVHADPKNPPLSVLFLTKLLKDAYGSAGVSLKSYRHSSCQQQLNEVTRLFNQPAEESSNGNAVDISIIWREVPDGEPQLLVQPTVQAPIRGETNVARYLSRLLPRGHPINYDSLCWDDVIRVDGLLERAADGISDFSTLENQLQSHNPCLLGEASIADFVNFSAVAASLGGGVDKLKKFSQVLKWFNACQEYGAFRL